MPRLGLRYQLTAWLLAIGVVPAAAGAAYLYSHARTELVRDTTSSMQGEAQAIAGRLADMLSAMEADIVLAADQVAGHLRQTPANPPRRSRSEDPPGLDFESVTGVLAPWGERATLPLGTWSVVDANGELRARLIEGERETAGTLSDVDRGRALATESAPNGTVLVDAVVESSVTARPVVTFATPIIGPEGAPIGSLLAELPIEVLARVIDRGATDGQLRWVLDERGRIIAARAGAEGGDVVAVVWSHLQTPRERAAWATIGSDRYLTASAPVPAVGGTHEPWIVALAISESAVSARLQPMRYVMVGAGLTAVVVLVGLLLGARIARPIQELADGTRRIAQGDLDFQLSIRGQNELEDLAGSFHQMAYELKRAQERLIKAERMAAIGEVSLVIHHEVETRVTAIRDFADSLRTRPDLPPEVRDQVTKIYEGALRVRDSLQKLDRAHERPIGAVADTPTANASLTASSSRAQGAA